MARSDKQRKLDARRRAKAEREKERRGPGRPRREGVSRTESGQISRAKEPAGDAMAVALAYRKTVYGLTDEQAKDQKACTALGRACLRKFINDTEYRAGERYLALQEAELKALKAPVGLAKAGAPGGGGDIVSEDYVTWTIRAIGAYEVAKGWLDDIELRSIVDAVVIAGTECDAVTAPYLKRGLAHLARRMGLELEVAA